MVELEVFGERRPIRKVGQRVVMGQTRNALLILFPLRDVFGNAEQVFRLIVVAGNGKPPGGNQALAVLTRLDHFFVKGMILRTVKYFEVAHKGKAGFVRRQQLEVGLADDLLARHSEKLFAGAIDQDIAMLLRFLDEEDRRHVFHDRIEERTGATQFLLRPPALGDVDRDAQRRQMALVRKHLGINDDIDRRSVRLDVPPDTIGSEHRPVLPWQPCCAATPGPPST